jgi:hypothetical protein
MGSILHIASQLSTERTYLHPEGVFQKIRRREPVPLGEPGEQRWALPTAITLVEKEGRDEDAQPAPWPAAEEAWPN